MWALDVASRLRELRRAQKIGQDVVARALEISVSEVSRLERGVRGVRLEQIAPWSEALGQRADLVLWDAGTAQARMDPEAQAVLREVAAALPHMPSPARKALAQSVQIWREEGELSATGK
jgi:transcriptional regulator with XRE-family HTH domain